MTTLLIESRRSQFLVFLIALVLLGALILGGAGGYLFKSVQVVPSSTSARGAFDRITGYPLGSVDDQRILAFLKQSGYEGGGSVVPQAVDRITGYPIGSVDDQQILAFLKQSGYEGGGAVVQAGSAGGAQKGPAALLDRNAERQQQGQTSRSGGPGGQIGDAP